MRGVTGSQTVGSVCPAELGDFCGYKSEVNETQTPFGYLTFFICTRKGLSDEKDRIGPNPTPLVDNR